MLISVANAEDCYFDVDTDSTFMYAVSEEFIWIIDAENRIKVFNTDTNYGNTFEFQTRAIAHINASDDGLYVNYWCEDSQYLMMIDEKGEILWDSKIDESMNIQRFVVADSKIFIVGNYEEYNDPATGFIDNYGLYYGDLTELEIRKCNTAGNVIAIDSCENNQELVVLLNNEEGYFVERYSIDNMRVLAEYAVPWLDYTAITDCNGSCYMLAWSDIYELKYDDSIVSLHKQCDGEIAGLDCANECIVTADCYNNRLIYIPAEANEKAQELVIANATKVRDRRMDAAIDQFCTIYPEVEINFIDINSEQLNTMLMSGESDIDILYVTNYTLPIYRESGAVCDLSGHAGIMTAMNDWYELPYLYADGVYHVPTMVLPKALLRNNEIDAAMEILYPYDWDALYEYGRELLEETGIPLIADYSIRFPVVLNQYMAYCCIDGTIDFDTPLFRKMISDYKRAYDDGIIVESCEDAYFIVTNVAAYPYNNSFYPLPLVEGLAVNDASLYALAVVSDSDMKEMAMNFLAYYATTDAQGVINYDAPGAGLISDIGCYGQGSYDVTAEDELLWETVVSSSVCLPFNNVDFSIYMGDQIEEYMHNEITLDELVEKLNNMYEMALEG